MMLTRTKFSEYTYIPYFKTVDESHLNKDEYGQRLSYPNAYIINHESSYEVKKPDSNTIIDVIPISQDETGIDTEDRIILLQTYLDSNHVLLY